jgi:hypothetical protein
MARDTLEDLTVQDARDAIRRDYVKRNYTAYMAAMKEVGRDLEYSSSAHLIGFVVGLATDSVQTFWEHGKGAFNSPLVKGFIRKHIGDRDLLDYVKELRTKDKTGEDREKAEAELSKGIESLKIMEEYPRTLIEYCKDKKRTPDRVLSSTRDRLALIERSYGSFAKYEEIYAAVEKNAGSVMKQIDDLGQAPVASMLPMLIMSQSPEIGGYIIAAGIDPFALGKIAESYSKDLIKFTKAYVGAYVKQNKNELEEYRKIKASL